MFWRALFAFLVLPGTMGFLIPLLLLRPPAGWPPFRPLGLLPVALGSALLLWCVRDFYVTGKGTLAPWSPPRHLVTVGLYRWSRNPMYLAVLLILAGWAAGFASRSLWLWTLTALVLFHVRVVFFEEPWLARRHGDTYARYRASVPRWLGVRRVRP